MSECLSCPAWLSDSETPDFLSHGALPVDTAFALCSEYNACAWLSGGEHVVAGTPYPDPRDKMRVLVDCICPPSNRALLVALPVMIEVHNDQ